MDNTDLLAFEPVPLRGRRDGWTPRHQYFFILLLARGQKPGPAARLLGMSRQTAYELRSRPGGEGFAQAWDAAVERIRSASVRRERLSQIERGLQGEWRPRLYRGRIVGWTHCQTNIGLMRVLNRLDKEAEKISIDTSKAGLRDLLERGYGDGS